MKKQIESVEDVRRALAEQDRKLRDAYERLEPGKPIPLATASLERLADQCTPMRSRAKESASTEGIDVHLLRC